MKGNNSDMINKIAYYLLATFIVIEVISCNSKSNNSPKTSIDSMVDLGVVDSNLLKKGVLGKLDFAITNLRNSDEFIQVLSKQTNLYSETVLNDVKKIHEYESSKAKAINLGIYGADLNCIIHFNQIPVSFKYLICAKQLSDQIGVNMAFDKKAVDKFNGNIDQKDTLINIVSSAYDIIKKYLRNDDQFQVATLVMTGSWVENMHLTLNLLDKCNNEQDKMLILSNVLNQKEYLKNLITLLALLNEQKDSSLQDLQNSMNEINVVFDKIKTTIPSPKEVLKLKEKIEVLRQNLVETK
jgi:hypothetical protein